MAGHDDDDDAGDEAEGQDQASQTQKSTTPLDARPEDPAQPDAATPAPSQEEPPPAEGAALPEPNQEDPASPSDAPPGHADSAAEGDEAASDPEKAAADQTGTPRPADPLAEAGDQDDEASHDPAQQAGEEGSEAGDETDPPDGEEADQDGGRDVMLGPEDGDVRLEGFKPGSDVLDIEVPHGEMTAFRSLDPETGDAQLRLFDGQHEQVITFAGLGSVPIDDIFLLMTDPETGDAISTALGEYLFDEDQALDPIKPDEPSTITPDDDDDGQAQPGLDPLSPDRPSVITPASHSTEPVTEPSDDIIAAAQVEATAAAGSMKAGMSGRA